MDLERENKLLREKIHELIADNMELSARLECDYDSEKSVRKLTLQEKLELNMGNLVLKYRIPSKTIKNMYYEIIKAVDEPQFIDITFDNDRMFNSFHFVNIKKEALEIAQGESVIVDMAKIPDNTPLNLQQQLDTESVINQLVK